MDTGQVEEIGRADAAKVYRYLRDEGPHSLIEIAEACFPLTFGRSDPLYPRLVKGTVRRVLGSIIWMRIAGTTVTVTLRPGDLSVVSIEPRPSDH